jgi:hypothetical protein
MRDEWCFGFVAFGKGGVYCLVSDSNEMHLILPTIFSAHLYRREILRQKRD